MERGQDAGTQKHRCRIQPEAPAADDSEAAGDHSVLQRLQGRRRRRRKRCTTYLKTASAVPEPEPQSPPAATRGAPGRAGVWGQQGSRAGHSQAVPASHTHFLQWQQERRECFGDVNADIQGPCQALHPPWLLLTADMGAAAGEWGPQSCLGATAQWPLPSAPLPSRISKAMRWVL